MREGVGKSWWRRALLSLAKISTSDYAVASRSLRARSGDAMTDGSDDEEPGGSLTNEQTYVMHVWVYACIWQIASRLAALAPIVKQRPSEEERQKNPDIEAKTVEGTWVNKLIEDPSGDGSSWYDLIEGTTSFLELSGNAYWEVVGGDVEKELTPVKVFLLRSDRIEVKPSKEHRVDHYTYSVDFRDKRMLTPEQVLQFRYFHPINEQTGMSPIDPASGSLTLDFWAQIAQRDFFKHGALPEGTLQTDGTLSDESYKRLREQWKQRYQGVSRQRKTLILEEGVNYQKMQATPVEAGLTQTRRDIRESILAAFGVPPVVVGVLEHASYANAKQQKAEFWDGTLLPKERKIYLAINGMIRKYSPDLFIVPDLSSIKHLLSDYEADQEERKVALEEVKVGARTVNEYRADILKKPKVSWGDEWFAPSTVVPASAVVGLVEAETEDEEA